MSDSRFQGIIYSLTQQCGSNPVDAGIIEITASSFTSYSNYDSYTKNDLRYIVDYDSDQGYYSGDNSPNWVLFDFKKNEISVNKYTIKFGYYTKYYNQKFLLQGSNDNQTWATIDNRESDSTKHTDFEIQEYTSNGDATTKFRFIRIYVSDACWFWTGNARIGLTSIEFFGEYTPLVPPQELPHSLSFKGTDGKCVNDSVGIVLLQGDRFTSILKRGIYMFSAFSNSGNTFVEGILKLLKPKECEVDAPTTIGSNTTVKLDDDILISAPSSANTEPFIHSSLHKASFIKNFYSTYSRVLRMEKLESGRVVISYSPLPSKCTMNKKVASRSSIHLIDVSYA